MYVSWCVAVGNLKETTRYVFQILMEAGVSYWLEVSPNQVKKEEKSLQ